MVKIDRFLYAVIFLKPLDNSFSSFSAIAKIKESFADDFEGIEPIQAYPAELKNQIPPDAPRYILNSNHFNITITGNRFDFNITSSDISFEAIKQKIERIQEVMLEINLPQFRVGAFFEGEIKEEEVRMIIKDYVNFDKLSEMIEWQLSYREVESVSSYSYNRWKRYFLLKGEKLVKYNYDVNNLNGITIKDIKENNSNILKLVGDLIGADE